MRANSVLLIIDFFLTDMWVRRESGACCVVECCWERWGVVRWACGDLLRDHVALVCVFLFLNTHTRTHTLQYMQFVVECCLERCGVVRWAWVVMYYYFHTHARTHTPVRDICCRVLL